MNDMNKQLPYESLGFQLKHLREHHSESLAEVSGAVEIDEKELNLIEAGQQRPSEDILLLLISHFAVHDDKAAELWQLAGYDKSATEENRDQAQANRTQTMMVMIDPRVMYSDTVEVVASIQGVVLNFSQSSGPNNQPLTIARIGMSHSQAKTVMGILHQVLYDIDNPTITKRLPGGEANQDNNK